MLNVDLFTINVVHRMRFLYKTLPRRTEKKHTKCGKILEWKIPKANNMHLWCMCVNVRVFDGIWCVDKLRSSQHAAGCYNVITVQNWQTFVIAPFSSSNKQRPATSVPINTHNTFALWSNTSDLFPYFFIFFCSSLSNVSPDRFRCGFVHHPTPQTIIPFVPFYPPPLICLHVSSKSTSASVCTFHFVKYVGATSNQTHSNGKYQKFLKTTTTTHVVRVRSLHMWVCQTIVLHFGININVLVHDEDTEPKTGSEWYSRQWMW